MSIRNSVVIPLCLALLGGCASTAKLPHLGLPTELPIGYRLNVQQGNVLKQKMLAQLEPGMEKKKVLFIMGTPSIQDTFHKDRWDYVYTFQRGRDVPKQRRVTLYFKDDKLVRVEGDVKAADSPLFVDKGQEGAVRVPPGQKPGILTKAVDALPFIGEKPFKPRKPEKDPDAALIVQQPEPQLPEEPAAEAGAAQEPQIAESLDDPSEKKAAPKKKGFFSRLFRPKDDRLEDVDAEDIDDDVRKNPKMQSDTEARAPAQGRR